MSFSCSSIVLSLWAVKAYPGLLTYLQPDGTEMNYYLRGDENFNYMVSEDGYLLTFDELGFLGYANLKEDVIVPSTQRVKATSLSVELDGMMKINQNRLYSPQYRVASNQGYPLVGSPKSLVILVNFSDVEFSSATANQDFVDLLNKAGYNVSGSTGSARDYFRRASNGVFDPEFVVVGPYTLPNDRKYYGEQVGDVVDKRPGNMIVDACELADPDVDYSEFDENKENDWFLLEYPIHQAFHKFIQELNQLITTKEAFYKVDYSWDGFKWMDADNKVDNIFIYQERARGSAL